MMERKLSRDRSGMFGKGQTAHAEERIIATQNASRNKATRILQRTFSLISFLWPRQRHVLSSLASLLLVFLFNNLSPTTCPLASAQSETATISGLVTDETGAVVPGAEVKLKSEERGTFQTGTTNNSGIYVFASVVPGQYQILLQKPGFKQVEFLGLIVNVQDHIEQNFRLQVGSVTESVTVEANRLSINTTDASVSTVVDRQFVENMPLNGRSFQSLIELTPGIVAVPGASTGQQGEFSVNGQRTETNNFTVDGVSANVGMNSGVGLLSGNGGTPAETALGTTHSLVSVDALQEFRINTSTYSAEFGRTPGAQISFETRSGTDAWHGSLFDYFRNDALDANDWFNNAAGLPKTAERQNDFGGTLGGPVQFPGLYNGKDKTFFFFSYEGLRLTIPQPAFTTDVPNTYMRNHAPAALQPLLNAFPIPNGADDPDCLPPGPPGPGATCLALFTGSSSSPSTVDAYSIRLDHALGDKLRIFGRYSDTPSHSLSRQAFQSNPALVNNAIINTKGVTVGATSAFSSRLANELRFNYTQSSNTQNQYLDNYGGARPLTAAQFFPGVTTPQAYFTSVFFFFGTFPGTFISRSEGPQHQWNIADSVSSTFGSHTLKYGIDYRRLTGTNNITTLQSNLNYSSPAAILSNTADLGGSVLGETPGLIGIFTNLSAFVQDEWKSTNRLHLSLGLRWDVNPPPRIANGPQPYTLDQITNLDTAQLAPAGTPIWHTDYLGFAPRVGLAYQARQNPGHETVLRTGFGVFYDVGNSRAFESLALGGVGIAGQANYPTASFPLTPAQLTPPAPSTASPYNGGVAAFDPHLRLPYTLQWNAAVEQGLGGQQTLTLSYVAAAGRRLLYDQNYELSALNPNFALGNGLRLVTNGSYSNYNSLQVQFQRHLSRGLQVLASYTWSHAIDDLSANFSTFPPVRGNADFDVRHNFSAALTYDVAGRYANPFLTGLLTHWGIDLRQTARSSLPVDIFSGYHVLSNGQQVVVRPDLVAGVPIYVSDPSAPGGRTIDIDAFTAPAAGLNGNAPRNFVRGFGLVQTDLAIRREFPLHERLKLQFRAEAFNLLNHPNFGTIDNNTGDGPALFGRAQSMLNQSLGGLNALYQSGGPRSLQLALKILF